MRRRRKSPCLCRFMGESRRRKEKKKEEEEEVVLFAMFYAVK